MHVDRLEADNSRAARASSTRRCRAANSAVKPSKIPARATAKRKRISAARARGGTGYLMLAGTSGPRPGSRGVVLERDVFERTGASYRALLWFGRRWRVRVWAMKG